VLSQWAFRTPQKWWYTRLAFIFYGPIHHQTTINAINGIGVMQLPSSPCNHWRTHFQLPVFSFHAHWPLVLHLLTHLPLFLCNYGEQISQDYRGLNDRELTPLSMRKWVEQLIILCCENFWVDWLCEWYSLTAEVPCVDKAWTSPHLHGVLLHAKLW